jgi:uncharacterized secreted protein with C-terminal beta-propeller domain
MAAKRPLSHTASPLLFVALAIATSCAVAPGAPAKAPATPPPTSGTPVAAPGPTTSGVTARAHAPRPVIPERAPPPAITTAMQGDPSGAALAAARLVTTTCEKATTEQVEARLKEMRAAVDASFQDWHDGQPQCWAQDREEYQWRRQMEREASVRGGSVIVSGGLSLSGVGYGGGGMGDAMGFGAGHGRLGGAHMVKASAQPRAAHSASGTNNQVAGVDEADIVKTDGRYVYLASNGALRIALAMDPKIVSVTKLPGAARELFVSGDRAVIYASTGAQAARCTYGYDCTFGGDGSSTKVLVFDVADHTAPKLVRELDLSGSLVAARRIGNAVHTVVADNDAPGPAYETWPANLDMCGTMENVVRAKFAKLKADNERKIRAKTTMFPTLRDQGVERALCDGLLRTAIRDGQAFTTVVSFDLTDDKSAAASATLQSRPGAVFASENALYLSVVHQKRAAAGKWYPTYSSVDEASEIHKFRIGSSPKDTRYVGSGIVPGHVLNQFAMDEWYGYLRVATTKGRVPDPKVASVLSVLAEGQGGNLVRVGAIDGIARGEDIRAVRFDDDRAYVVTFKKTDPLFVMDLYQPAHPVILGELKIPGFSTYIHRIDPEHLLSIGFDANDHGDFAYFDGVILQLFDVKNPTEPRLLHKEKIGTRGSSSEAATDHLAFNYFADRGLLAIPMTICEGGGDGRNGGDLTFSGLLVYDVDLDRGFTRLGGIDHGKKGVSCGTWWSNANSAVKRSLFLDDLVYSIATDRVKVQRMGRFGEDVADLSLTP